MFATEIQIDEQGGSHSAGGAVDGPDGGYPRRGFWAGPNLLDPWPGKPRVGARMATKARQIPENPGNRRLEFRLTLARADAKRWG
jgi:hypothetical protein